MKPNDAVGEFDVADGDLAHAAHGNAEGSCSRGR